MKPNFMVPQGKHLLYAWFSEFPVKLGGVGAPPAAFLNENRTSCRRIGQRAEIRVLLGRDLKSSPNKKQHLDVSSPVGR
jgi:hypothetical protein